MSIHKAFWVRPRTPPKILECLMTRAALAITFALGRDTPGLRETLGGVIALLGSLALIKAKLKAEKLAARRSA